MLSTSPKTNSKNAIYEFSNLKKLANGYRDGEIHRIIEGRVREWGDWDFSVELPGLSARVVEAFAWRMVRLLENSEPSLSVMFKECPEQFIWEKALKKAVAKELNTSRVFAQRVAPNCYELRYTRSPVNRILAADLQTITKSIQNGCAISFVYPGAEPGALESTRFVQPLSIELNEAGQVYFRARRISGSQKVTRNYLVTRGHSYVEHFTPNLAGNWCIGFTRHGSFLRAELSPVH